MVQRISIAENIGISEQVSFQEGDMNSLPFDDDAFDWVWSANCAGYAPGAPLPLLKELARVVNPGGSVIILAWSSQQLLPGYPMLEAHLNATSSGIAPFAEGMAPELHFSRMMGWFRRAGMEEVTARTFVGDVCAPLSKEMRSALAALMEMRWVDVEPELSEGSNSNYGLEFCLAHTIIILCEYLTRYEIKKVTCFLRKTIAILSFLLFRVVEDSENFQNENCWSEGDWADYQRLCLAESPEFILDLPDYYAFYTYSMFWGSFPGA